MGIFDSTTTSRPNSGATLLTAGGQPNGDAGQQQTRPSQKNNPQHERAARTFAQLQAAGQARPAPPQAQGADDPRALAQAQQALLAGQSGGDMRSQLDGALAGMFAPPGEIGPEAGLARMADMTGQAQAAPVQAQQAMPAQQAAGQVQAAPPQAVAMPAQAQQAMPAQAPQAPQAMPAQQSGGDMRSQLDGALAKMFAQPSAYDDKMMQAQYERFNTQLGQQGADDQRQLAEQMATRGLDASTVHAAGLGRLGERQGQQRADMMAQLQEKAAMDRNEMLGRTLGLGLTRQGQLDSVDQSNKDRNQRRDEFGVNTALTREKYAQDAEQFGKSLGLDKDKMAQAQKQFDASLGLDKDKMAQAAAQFEKSFGLSMEEYKTRKDQFDKQFGAQNEQWKQDFDWKKENGGTQNWLEFLRLLGIDKYAGAGPTGPTGPGTTGGAGGASGGGGGGAGGAGGGGSEFFGGF